MVTEINEITCKYCGADGVLKYGSYKGVPRYWCKVCQRKFKAGDTTFHMKTDTNLVSSALNMYYEGMPIRAIRRNLLQEHNQAPSLATIYEWIQKYTQYATDSVKDYHPKVGDVWIGDETVLKIGGQNLWLWDIIDEKTRFLLATLLTPRRTTEEAQTVINRAVKIAGKHPKVLITDKLPSYVDIRYDKDTEHRQGSPFGKKNTGESTSQIERFHGTLKQRTKVMKGLKNYESALEFTGGWLVHYNYLRPHDSLQDKTPAEVAGVKYPYQNWADIIRNHQPTTKVIIEHQPRGISLIPTHIGRPKGVRLSPKMPRVTQRTPKISDSVYISKSGVMSRHPFRGGRRRRIR